MTKFTFPNSEKGIEMKKVISKDGEPFVELCFTENDDLKFDVKVNRVQLDYILELAYATLKE